MLACFHEGKRRLDPERQCHLLEAALAGDMQLRGDGSSHLPEATLAAAFKEQVNARQSLIIETHLAQA